MVTVNVAELVSPPSKPMDFAVLFDPSCSKINETHLQNPKLVIFSFVTCRPEEVPDMSGLIQSDFIVTPMYIGNIDRSNWIELISQFAEALVI